MTGQGQTIAIFEVSDLSNPNGYDLTHSDLASKVTDGQILGCYVGTQDGCDFVGITEGHGTNVAGIAAGAFNGSGIVGVAPEANLLLFVDDGDEDFSTDLYFSVAEATESGAIALSNSWVFTKNFDDNTDDCPDDPAHSDYWKCFYWTDIQYAVTWGTTFDTLAGLYDAYQNVGVVVVTKPNEDSGLQTEWGSLLADLPEKYDFLNEAWISVTNARFNTDDQGRVTNVIRDSSPCNRSAAWCLVGNGHINTAEVGGGYRSGTGTSYFAPQVAGGVALVAEAFPTLNSAELTSRILASANREWFLSGSIAKDELGGDIYDPSLLNWHCWTIEAAPEICRWISQEWGHGIMDLEAALSPIDGLTFVTGVSLAAAARTDISAATLTVPTGSYGALQTSLSIPLTTFDALNGNFAINTADLVYEEDTISAAVSLLQRFERQQTHHAAPLAVTIGDFSYSATYDTSAEGLPNAFEVHHVSAKTGIHAGFGFASSDTNPNFGGLAVAGRGVNPIGFTGLMGDTAYATLGFGGGDGVVGGGLGAITASDLTLFGFTAENANNSDGSISGIGARYGIHFDDTQFEISASRAAEQGSYLGISGDEDIWFGGTASLTAGQIVVRHDLGEGLNFTARAELGSLSGGADEGKVSLISQMDDTLYSGFEVALEQQDMFVDDDALAIWISQPMRVEDSDMTLTLASGRTKEGDILYTDYQAHLTPEERQIDIGLSYSFTSNEGAAQTQFGVMQSFNHGHMEGESATSVALRHAMRF